jgi:hypothetical protein
MCLGWDKILYPICLCMDYNFVLCCPRVVLCNEMNDAHRTLMMYRYQDRCHCNTERMDFQYPL